jgi:hypothetical protein
MSVTTVMKYFSRDKKFIYEEKPYILSFPVDEIPGARSTNHEFVHTTTQIQALRALPMPSLDIEGFTYLSLPTRLSCDDFALDENVHDIYFKEITTAIKELFPRYTDIVYVDHQVGEGVSDNAQYLTFRQDQKTLASVPNGRICGS